MEKSALCIQKVWKGYIYRKKTLPNSLRSITVFLNNVNIKCSSNNSDGRINSCFDENTCKQLLKKEYKDRIIFPKYERHWYDVLVKDYRRGLLPCNIKSTLMKGGDNTGNLSLCVYSYTNYNMDLHKKYNNGEMGKVLYDKIKNKQYNTSLRDYYFIVINKKTSLVIINGCKGLCKLTHNVNNLPFQINWKKNKVYNYKPIHIVVDNFIKTINKSRSSWKETFLHNMRSLNIDE